MHSTQRIVSCCIRVVFAFLVIFSFGCQPRGLAAESVRASLEKTGSVVPAPKSGQYMIVYWNACNFGKTKKADILNAMSEMVKNADIVVILEVSVSDAGAQAVARFSDTLNRKGAKWDYIVSDPTSGEGSERVAICWKTSRVEGMRKTARLLLDVASSIDREPFFMDFRVDGKLLSVGGFHAVPTAKHPEHDFAVLAESSLMRSGERMIFGGDFNLPAKKVQAPLRSLGLETFLEVPTSLGTKIHADGSYFSKEYDHICTRGIHVKQVGIADQVQYMNNDLTLGRNISDHVPVYACICLD